MKPIGEAIAAAERAKRYREWNWCRRQNGFSDMPLWRVVAARCGVPLPYVVAFVNRLEEFANVSGNIGETRGSVARFDAEEFAAALGMSVEEAARIFAALADDRAGWIHDRHIATFWDRNRDREEDAEDVRNRKRRSRSRKAVRETLARLALQGKIPDAERLAIEVSLSDISDADLALLQSRLATSELSTAPPRSRLVTCDIVTVTPEKSRDSNLASVENSEGIARGETDGLPMGDEGASEALPAAARWVSVEGKQLLIDRLQVRPLLAETYIERWRRDLGDDDVLKAIIEGADRAGYIGARFHTIITDQVRRALIARDKPQLSLMPPRPGQRRDSA